MNNRKEPISNVETARHNFERGYFGWELKRFELLQAFELVVFVKFNTPFCLLPLPLSLFISVRSGIASKFQC